MLGAHWDRGPTGHQQRQHPKLTSATHNEPAHLQLLVAHSILEFQKQPAGTSLSSYLWDMHNPNTPMWEMAGTSPTVCARFNLKDHAIVCAGQYNGQLMMSTSARGLVQWMPHSFSTATGMSWVLSDCAEGKGWHMPCRTVQTRNPQP